ncbi:MAG: NAD(P)H-hydrate dehydratase [Rhodospirillales bacterium]|nr:NAD(P)H-hydrate dehydratase [Rhodospirillales bacterium]
MEENALLTVQEMAAADAQAIAGGIPGLDLMEAAGGAVVRQIVRRWPRQPVAVLCGPGNNGGDGFVVARLLAGMGWPAHVALLGSREALKGDAATNAKRWRGETRPLTADALGDCCLVVDALFGAGLARPVEGAAKAAIETVNARRLHCVAVDIPSGVRGDTGEVLGVAPQANVTVTFFRPKPGHYLMPGRVLCGEFIVSDIGIPASVLPGMSPKTRLNGPALWLSALPWPRPEGNKYSRGHAVVVGGPEMTGAARLAARGARRIGAGLVTIASPPEVFAIYASDTPGTLVAPVADDGAFARFLEDKRKNAVLVGPGAGISNTTRRRVATALGAGRACVLDAGALTAFADDPQVLFSMIAGPCVLTPHEGEFRRLFRLDGDKLARARAAAKQSGAVVLLKGFDTVIAAPDGRAVIDANAPPDLATAGAGDVLAGLLLGLIAQGMDPFTAASAAVWIEGEAARRFGPGLISEDLPEQIPSVLHALKERVGKA